MFQSSRMASGMCRRHSSTACWPSSASLIWKSMPSRMRRATLRVTLEWSTPRQVLITSSFRYGCSTHRIHSKSRRQRLAAVFEHAVDVEDRHELTLEPVHAARNAREMRIEIHRVRLPRAVGKLEH